MRRSGSTSDPYWYKDAIVYEVHVRSFYDAGNDGTGDFRGLTEKLDYLQDLGITCIWLLPFYPSPLRDDGYDIARYEGVHPAYGTLRDFRIFMREAHARGLQIITELVVNHTSDQHPWFQAARRATPGTSKRNFYVWSDTNRKYHDARIIFTDSERSNWTWDDEAKAYYWHRFFHHQPDLNYDNPSVRRAILRVMRFWLDMGVDGLRLDAVPYLIEREGTNCENLPETHEVLKELRRQVDARYEHRMLLAEANQWPADVRAYMGEGDECHMAFHFPLMPRIFMALRQEDRHPITEILEQTPEIPDNCQWALFLRNHDELTLETVSDEERDYMYNEYAADPQMRLNAGIRRRLAPLMENSRRRIELLNALLFSLPGTPIVYYGDEIGMGDNIYLGDRNGVRTPMQWTGDRNAGFSKADPARLYAPPIMDPVYGYQAINVEAQERSPYSLLNWMKRMIGLRKQHRTFGRGSLTFLPVRNRKVLAYARSSDDETILAVANLSRTVQPAELDLSAFRGLMPVEMLGRTEFPRIGDLPYFITLGPYSFYWFELVRTPTPIAAHAIEPAPEPSEAPPPLLVGRAWETLLDGNVRALIEGRYLGAFLQRQRWFGGRTRAVRSARIADWGLVRGGADPALFAVAAVEYADGGTERYALPLAFASGGAADAILRDTPEAVLARIKGARRGVLYDAFADGAIGDDFVAAIRSGRRIVMRRGSIEGWPLGSSLTTPPPPAKGSVRVGGTNQSNSSLVFDDKLLLKLFRRLEPGPNPDFEVPLHLASHGFTRVPPPLGAVRYTGQDRSPADVAILQGFVQSQANGWDHAVEQVGRFFEDVSRQDLHAEGPPPLAAFLQTVDVPPAVNATVGAYLQTATKLGVRAGEMHLALAAGSDPAFVPEPLTRDDLDLLKSGMTREAGATLEVLGQAFDQLPAAAAARAEAALGARDAIVAVFDRLSSVTAGGQKARVHGDLHLGRVLWTDADFVFLDFEGEPARPLAERQARQSPLKDVAGMIRSFGYAAGVGLAALAKTQPAERERLAPWARIWQVWSAGMFLHGYRATVGPSVLLPAEPLDLMTMLRAFMLEKALYELRYELNHRRGWTVIPLAGVLELLEPEAGQ
jgi:maltose alpha-D-glucosyltransferase/alpha-amylase